MRSLIPPHRALTEVRLIGKMARERGIMSENDVLHHRLPRTNRFEKLPQMRAEIVVIVSVVGLVFHHWFFAGGRVVLFVPLLRVGVSQARWIRAGVIARRNINSSLRSVRHAELAQFDSSLR